MTVVRESGAHEIGKPNPSDFVANEDVIGIIRPRQPRRIEDCSANTIPSLDIEIADCLGYKKKVSFGRKYNVKKKIMNFLKVHEIIWLMIKI